MQRSHLCKKSAFGPFARRFSFAFSLGLATTVVTGLIYGGAQAQQPDSPQFVQNLLPADKGGEKTGFWKWIKKEQTDGDSVGTGCVIGPEPDCKYFGRRSTKKLLSATTRTEPLRALGRILRRRSAKRF